MCFFFQAEDGIRDLVRSRGLGDVYKRQCPGRAGHPGCGKRLIGGPLPTRLCGAPVDTPFRGCLLYTSDAADDLLCVDLGGRRIIKKKNTHDDLSQLNTAAVSPVLHTFNLPTTHYTYT